MTLAWTLNRLRNMSPAEVLHRIVEKGRKVASRRRHQGWEPYRAQSLHPVWPELRARILAAGPEQHRAIASAAEAFLGGRFLALGRDWPAGSIEPPYDTLWRLDPVTGRSWPGADRYAFDIDFRHDGSRGDIKYVWEINRLQMLPALAAHALVAGDRRSLEAIEALVASWHRTNPPFGGVGWASGIEVAVRAISLLLTIELVGARLSRPAVEAIGQVLAASAFWLPRFPSLHSSANNHYVAELVGEVLLAQALGTDGRAARIALLAQVDRQILPDGAPAEQSPTYGAFTAELALLAAEAARQTGHPFSAPAERRLSAFAGFIDWIGPAGRFGDDDEGRAISVGAETDYAGSVASAIAGVFGQATVDPRSDFRGLVFGSRPDAKTPPTGLRAFDNGGLSVWRGTFAGRAAVLLFDHGPLGYLSIAAHGHADALSVTLDIDGRAILVDPGTYLYGSGGAWRNWFRSTPAHNTLHIGGQSQSTMSGAFNWAHKARTIRARQGGSFPLVAEHDGYQSRFGAVHRRTITLGDDGFAISDQLLGSEREANIVWQFAEGVEVQFQGNAARASWPGGALDLILPPGSTEVFLGRETPDGGWVSPRFGVLRPAPRLVWSGLVGKAGATTRIRLAGIN
ncbi:alginate lyase family protein [Devosia sp. PTR5]|uniref:Alginate lyase family protein n=1 Tax=Devosia oryzisoli TaxID=2774138 RepID=A0A927FVK5_9HYPH|nr:heparinase II/III family protein [Devosia oryzisoli]MBD8066761.1 alginate lyase family protein [Devosia oryzisoli]